METITAAKLEPGMIVADEVNESAYYVLRIDRDPSTVYVQTRALLPDGTTIQKNFTYLLEDGELYVISRPRES